MKTEVLYPEVANLYGELANIDYMHSSCPGSEVIETHLGDVPAFLHGGVDLVYMGTMTESSQLLVIDALSQFVDEITDIIEEGQHMLMTGNAHEVFGNAIIDMDEMPYDDASDRVDATRKRTECLGIFNTTAERYMMHRYNSLYLGKYCDITITGSKSTFSLTICDRDRYEPLFETTKGPGFDLTQGEDEGIRYNNYMATYVLGPLFPLNPPLVRSIMNELGCNDVSLAEEDAAMDAYNARVREFSEPDRGFEYE